MDITAYIIPALAATLVFTLYWLAVNMAGKKDSVSERVKRMVPLTSDKLPEESTSITLESEQSGLAKACQQILEMVGINVEKYRREENMKFYRAGWVSPDAPVYYLFYKKIFMWFVLGSSVLLFTANAQGTTRILYIFCGLLLVLFALLGADIMMTNARQKRQKLLVRSFPDSLDLLLVCIESGLALDGALARVCKELGRAHPEITMELNRTRLELTLLNDRIQALQNLAERTDLVPFKSLTAMLTQSEKFGTSLTETLRVLSEDYRLSRLMAAENKAGRLPALMTIPLICFMLPSFFLIVMGPVIIKLMGILKNQ